MGRKLKILVEKVTEQEQQQSDEFTTTNRNDEDLYVVNKRRALFSKNKFISIMTMLVIQVLCLLLLSSYIPTSNAFSTTTINTSSSRTTRFTSRSVSPAPSTIRHSAAWASSTIQTRPQQHCSMDNRQVIGFQMSLSSNSENDPRISSSSSSSSTILSTSNTDNTSNDDYSTTTSTLQQDAMTIVKHITFCMIFAIVISFYEGYDCAYLKPEAATLRNFPTTYTTTMNTKTVQSINDERITIMNAVHSRDDDLDDSTIQSTDITTSPNKVQNILSIMRSGTRGMGRGRIDRLDGWYQNTYFGFIEPITTPTTPTTTTITNNNGDEFSYANKPPPTIISQNFIRQVPSYNEIMEEHRMIRVPRWKQIESTFSSITGSRKTTTTTTATTNARVTTTEKEVTIAMESIYNALSLIEQVKVECENYNWDTVLDLLSRPTLKSDLWEGCSILRGAIGVLDSDVRSEIGFDWGSCAWRHCGAQADAQEALSELYNSIGLFEPFECLFTLDIVERSLLDIIAVVPDKYHPTLPPVNNDDNNTSFQTRKEEVLNSYVPYQSQAEQDGISFNEDGEEIGNYDPSIDSENFLKILSRFRNDLSTDDNGDDDDDT